MEIVNPGDIKVEVNDDFDDSDNNNTRLTSAEQPLALVKKKNIEIDNITERFPYIDEVNKFLEASNYETSLKWLTVAMPLLETTERLAERLMA